MSTAAAAASAPFAGALLSAAAAASAAGGSCEHCLQLRQQVRQVHLAPVRAASGGWPVNTVVGAGEGQGAMGVRRASLVKRSVMDGAV